MVPPRPGPERSYSAVAPVLAPVLGALLVRRVDMDQVRRVLAGARRRYRSCSVLLALGADMTARIARWWYMLRAVEPDLPFGACARPFLASLALNNTLPFRAGDVGARGRLPPDAPRPGRARGRHAGAGAGARPVDPPRNPLRRACRSVRGAFPAPFIVAGALVGVAALAALLALTFVARHARSASWITGWPADSPAGPGCRRRAESWTQLSRRARVAPLARHGGSARRAEPAGLAASRARCSPALPGRSGSRCPGRLRGSPLLPRTLATLLPSHSGLRRHLRLLRHPRTHRLGRSRVR